MLTAESEELKVRCNVNDNWEKIGRKGNVENNFEDVLVLGGSMIRYTYTNAGVKV